MTANSTGISSGTPPFVHRRDPPWGYASFCRTCFRTVAKSEDELELTQHEAQHRCMGPPLALPDLRKMD